MSEHNFRVVINKFYTLLGSFREMMIIADYFEPNCKWDCKEGGGDGQDD